MAKGPKPRPVADRFWNLVEVTDPESCWPWRGARVEGGYGVFSTLGDGWDGYKRWLVHRLAHQLTHGDIPAGFDVDHLCHDETCRKVKDCPHRGCCNPAHLEAVPHRANVLRSNSFMAARARQTHCIHGHEFTPENTRVKPTGNRDCKTCNREQNLRNYHRRKGL